MSPEWGLGDRLAVPLADPVTAELAKTTLAFLDDRIIRTTGRHGLDVIDLRAVCPDPA